MGVFLYMVRQTLETLLQFSGITGVTFDWYDMERVSNTEVRIKLTFNGGN